MLHVWTWPREPVLGLDLEPEGPKIQDWLIHPSCMGPQCSGLLRELRHGSFQILLMCLSVPLLHFFIVPL